MYLQKTNCFSYEVGSLNYGCKNMKNWKLNRVRQQSEINTSLYDKELGSCTFSGEREFHGSQVIEHT